MVTISSRSRRNSSTVSPPTVPENLKGDIKGEIGGLVSARRLASGSLGNLLGVGGVEPLTTLSVPLFLLSARL